MREMWRPVNLSRLCSVLSEKHFGVPDVDLSQRPPNPLPEGKDVVMANQQKPETPSNAQKQQSQSPNERDRQQQQGNPSRQPGQNQDADRNQRQQSQGNPKDGSMVGKDTDGDGKVVKPGQTPGQSHGTGIKPDQKR